MDKCSLSQSVSCDSKHYCPAVDRAGAAQHSAHLWRVDQPPEVPHLPRRSTPWPSHLCQRWSPQLGLVFCDRAPSAHHFRGLAPGFQHRQVANKLETSLSQSAAASCGPSPFPAAFQAMN